VPRKPAIDDDMQASVLSIIIPTTGERRSLAAAVESALACQSETWPVEVMVVFNGCEARPSRDDGLPEAPQVQYLHAAAANANLARNIGMAHARGTYVRFLDDDDVLSPDGCRAQLSLIEHTSADVCSAPVLLVDSDEREYGVALQPGTPDFVAGAMSAGRMLQCTAHLFRRSSIADVLWDERLPYSQDIDWMLRLCAHAELRWVKSEQACGRWSRHTRTRISTSASLQKRKRIVSDGLLDLVGSLASSSRLTQHRREAAASGLWECVRSSMAFAPFYWAAIARRANAIAPGSSPPGAIHHSALRAIGLPPVRIEQALVPKRLVEYGVRRARLALGMVDRW
jgi:hypothetical protein